MPREPTVRAQQAALDAVAANRKCREKVNKVVQRPAELDRKRTEGRPVPGCEQHRQWNVGQNRKCDETDKKGNRAIMHVFCQANDGLKPLGCERMETRSKQT